jgi:hypothetical protein
MGYAFLALHLTPYVIYKEAQPASLPALFPEAKKVKSLPGIPQRRPRKMG